MFLKPILNITNWLFYFKSLIEEYALVQFQSKFQKTLQDLIKKMYTKKLVKNTRLVCRDL